MPEKLTADDVAADRLWKFRIRVARKGTPDRPECRRWRGSINSNGHPVFQVETRKTRQAARVAYALAYGEVPEGLAVVHACGNTLCVNPDHLNLADPSELVPQSKLTPAEAVLIRESDLPVKEVAELYGITQSTVYGIRAGRIWK